MDITKVLAQTFNLKEEFAENIITLIDEGSTIPFIARYRKEAHGSCDDTVLRDFADKLGYLRNLVKRKEEITKLLTEQGNITPELSEQIDKATTLTELEDIYRPFRPKRKTRASVAIEKGLKPLAELIWAQNIKTGTLLELAEQYINPEKGVGSAKDALAGASDIIAEIVADDKAAREVLREFLMQKGEIVTAWVETAEKAKVYETYKDYHEPLFKMPSHRILAINRGETDGALKVTLRANNELCVEKIEALYLKKNEITHEFVKAAILDGWERLLFPSLERELRNTLTERANEQAIKMFDLNLRPLLMQPPLKGKTIMAVDPAYRTGCKIAVINSSGDVLDSSVVYPTPPQSRTEESIQTLSNMIKRHGVNTISIGNGTASKEAEIFVSELIKRVGSGVQYAVVNEAGASVYSASKLGASEFPQYDVSIRSAISIARRLQDPLAELIKIDTKSIGVGQYQHDMPQKRLGEVLDGVVEDCVNTVGVDLNTASVSLLTFVSGLNSATAKSIVDYRAKNKGFVSRDELKKVPKLGDKAYEQCAGFLRIPSGKNILDNTSVHPESYAAAEKLLAHFNFTEEQVRAGELITLENRVKAEGEEKIAKLIGVGVPTLNDIVAELMKPGRDVRDSLPQPVLRSDLLSLEDLKPNMVLDGVVRNVIDFGAFIDIGVHQDGLVHISQICNRYIKHPSEELKVGDPVTVKVLAVDIAKQRISLTMKDVEKP
ncbi:MAG: RNA-binding transcriptional accessory protein [Firmicutes bacterium]|nr:RNA-binding transcriptional accessory protein [Bacillota bacterium]